MVALSCCAAFKSSLVCRTCETDKQTMRRQRGKRRGTDRNRTYRIIMLSDCSSCSTLSKYIISRSDTIAPLMTIISSPLIMPAKKRKRMSYSYIMLYIYIQNIYSILYSISVYIVLYHCVEQTMATPQQSINRQWDVKDARCLSNVTLIVVYQGAQRGWGEERQ